MIEFFIKRSADFSDCRTWRYTLIRQWDSTKPRLLMILLNPSTADENHDDPTNRRGIQYAIDWGFGSLVFCNLFAYRTPSPKELKAAENPVGPDNDHWILLEAERADMIMLGWGNHGSFLSRDEKVLYLLKDRALFCLAKNKSGKPKHPLYCRGDLKPMPFLRLFLRGGSNE